MPTYHWVSGYYRKDGTYVKGHYQTNPDNSKSNNWSTVGNVNPFTGKPGTVVPTGTNSTYGSSGSTTTTSSTTGSSSTTTPPLYGTGGNATVVERKLANGVSTKIAYWDDYLVQGKTSGSFVHGTEYTGPVNRLDKQVICDDNAQTVYGTTANDFINCLGGDDAVDGGPGDDVLDGGSGSNFLTGADGLDTFFVDGRGLAQTWSTVTDLEVGESINIWGDFSPKSIYKWEEKAGAPGFEGRTLAVDINGDGRVDARVTLSGLTGAANIQVSQLDTVLILTRQT